jgi:thymidylate synthase (FAD)
MPDDDAIARYLESVGADDFTAMRSFEEPEDLVEFAGRMCYRSWQPGLNPNIRVVRQDQGDYIDNILKSGHGSVLEHVTWTLVFKDVSRVLTHELVRHRPGVAISQESMRYVRLTDIPFWFPDWAQQDTVLWQEAQRILTELECFQGWMARHFGLDDPTSNFTHKKHMTSFMRRFAPEGVATSVTWTANVRTLRHVITERTSPGAEEEIRLVFGKVAELMTRESPMLFGDFKKTPEGAWVPEWRKV